MPAPLVVATAVFGFAVASAAAVMNALIGAVKLATGAIGKAGDLAGGITKAFTGLDISLKHLSSTFKQSIAATDELQKRNLALGRDFAGFSKTFGTSIDRLPGAISSNLGTAIGGLTTAITTMPGALSGKLTADIATAVDTRLGSLSINLEKGIVNAFETENQVRFPGEVVNPLMWEALDIPGALETSIEALSKNLKADIGAVVGTSTNLEDAITSVLVMGPIGGSVRGAASEFGKDLAKNLNLDRIPGSVPPTGFGKDLKEDLADAVTISFGVLIPDLAKDIAGAVTTPTTPTAPTVPTVPTAATAVTAATAATAVATSIDIMPGVLSEKLGTIITAIESGLRGDTSQTHSLLQFVRMTGGNFKALAAKLESTQTTLAFNNNSLESLSMVTRVAVDKYGVAADRMIESIDKLSEQTRKTVILAEKGGDFAEAMVKLSGELGGRAGGAQGAIQDILFGGSEGFGQAAVLGLLGARQRAQQGGPEAILDASLEVINAWPRISGMLQSMGPDIGIASEALLGFAGAADQIKVAFEALHTENTALVRGQQKQRDVSKQLGELNKKMWEKIQELWLGDTGFYSTLLDNAEEISDMFDNYVMAPLSDIVATFTDLFLGSTELKDSFAHIIKQMGKFLIATNLWLGETFDGKGTMYHQIVGWFAELIGNISKQFEQFINWTIPAIGEGFHGIIYHILSILRWIPGAGVDPEHVQRSKERFNAAKLDRMAGEFKDRGLVVELEKVKSILRGINLIENYAIGKTEGEKHLAISEILKKADLVEMIGGVAGWGGHAELINLITGEWDPLISVAEFDGPGSGFRPARDRKELIELITQNLEKTIGLVAAKADLISTGPFKGIAKYLRELEEATKDDKTKGLWERTIAAIVDLKDDETEEELVGLGYLADAQATELSNHITSILMREGEWRADLLSSSKDVHKAVVDRIRDAADQHADKNPPLVGGSD